MQITAENAAEYARQRGLVGPDERPRVEPLSGGVACSVMRIHTKRGPVVIKQAQERFRVKEEWLVDPRRNIVEARFQILAREVLGADHVPEVLDVDEANFAFTMASAPPGSENWKTMTLDGNVQPDLGGQCGRLLVKLQRIPTDDPRLPAEARDPQFFYQQRIEPYFEFTAARHPDVPQIRDLIPFLTAPRCITHGDYTPKNFLVANRKLILLDYEVVHIGVGEFDIASIVNHLTLKAFHLPSHRTALRATAGAFLDALFSGGVTPDTQWLPLLGALMLARVDGKSPAEYLREQDKPRIREVAKQLLRGRFASYEAFYSATF
jgi:5-methylthioribose kinase